MARMRNLYCRSLKHRQNQGLLGKWHLMPNLSGKRLSSVPYSQLLLRQTGMFCSHEGECLQFFCRPEIPGAVGQTIFHSLCDLLGQPIVQRQVANRSEATTRRQPARKTKEKNKRRRARLLLGILHEHGILHEQELGPFYNTPHDASSAQTSKPILCGLNSLTRQLQDSIHDATRQKHREDAPKKHSPSYIFCCIDDIDPPSLVAHLPLLVAAYNAVHDTSICLVRLPVGAEGTIANKVGLRRCAILSVDADELSHSCSSSTQAVDALRILMENIAKGGIEPMRLGWIKEALHGKAPYLEPRIKHLRSSAPVDVNAIKAAKREARKQRKGQGR